MRISVNRSLTPQQKKLLDYIESYFSNKGYSPSLMEMKEEIKVNAISTVHQHVQALVKKGYLKKEDNQPRGVTIMEQTGEVKEIPLLGFIAAGSPIEPIENPEPIKVPMNLLKKGGDYYALKVKGDSMIDDGIWDGDTVILKSQNTAEDGDTVVAITEYGATLKIFKKNKNSIWLEPRNSRLKNIYPVSVEIRGKFIGLIRNG